MSYQLPLFEITSCKCDVILNCFLLGSRTRSCGSERRKILRSLWKIPEKKKSEEMLKQHVQKFPDLHRSHSWVWGLLQWQKFASIRKNGQSENWKEKEKWKNWIIEYIFLYFFRFSWLMKLVLTSSWSKYKSSRQTIAFKNLWKCLLMWCLLLMRQQQIFVIAVYDEH